MKKWDFLLGICIILAAIGIYVAIGASYRAQGDMIAVQTADGTVSRYSLLYEEEIKIGDGNTLIIKGGKADMIFANCPDQVCVHSKPVSKMGETIICLPNKVVIEVLGQNGEDKPDAIVR